MTTPAVKITVSSMIHAPIAKVWRNWTSPEHITQWNFASNDWKCPKAVNNLTPGGTFSYRMESVDGTMGFDFNGTYETIIPNEQIDYRIEDGRRVSIEFIDHIETTEVIETFEAESMNPVDMQQAGWQAILNQFKYHTEND